MSESTSYTYKGKAKKYRQKKVPLVFCPQKVEKNTLKSCSEFLKSTFFLTALTAQTAQTEEFLFQNVAY
jgi:hypothetical protein